MNNLKLRKAIIIAIALAGTGHSLHSQAIGLGDIQVKSSLGQPLLANIKVYGIDKKMDETCFNISSDDTNAISQVNFKLKRLANEEGVLTLTSRQAVLEPIAALTVVNQCDTPFTRQYNLLIDPASAENLTMSDIAVVNQIGNVVDSESATENINTEPVIKKSKKKKSARAKKSNHSPINSNVATANNEVNAQVTYKASDEAIALDKASVASSAANKAKLVISGSNFNSGTFNKNAVALKFDTKINTSRETNPQAYSEEAEFSDEVTVMNNRLSHLEKQLTGLSIKNAALEKLNKDNSAQLSKAKQQNDFLRMLSFCLGGGLLASSYFFADWLRRRKNESAVKKDQLFWEQTQQQETEKSTQSSLVVDDTFVPQATANSFEVKTEEDLSEFEQSHIFNSPFTNLAPSKQIEIEEDTDIKENADVYVSHGRTTLAIQLLQNHLMESPKKSASTWVFLLDLLAREDRQKEYEIAAAEFKKHFNVQPSDFSAPTLVDNSLESFERISSELQKVWGTREALVFLDELIYNTRLEPRMGFDQAVFEELLLLRDVAQEEISSAEVIQFSNQKSNHKDKKEPVMTLNLPEIEMSPEFKQLGSSLALENAPKTNEGAEQFEFELLDIASR